jgi:hypothetical protein
MDLKEFPAMIAKRFGVHNINPLGDHLSSTDPAYLKFSKGKRGAVLPEPTLETGKVKISIRLDEDVLRRFFIIAGSLAVMISPM